MLDVMTWGDGLNYTPDADVPVLGWPLGVDDSSDGASMSEAVQS